MLKTIDYYMGLRYRMILEPDTEDGGWAVSFPDLPGCLTCGDTLDDALHNAEDARREWLIAALEMGISISEGSAKASA